MGGTGDTIADTETNRDELLKIGYGVWAYIKNHPDGRGRRWELEWIGALPGKRENVRYVGDHILTQNDVLAGGRFDDIVAYGGWPMDDHHPDAIHYPGEPTIFHKAPSPYGIPYRGLYSRNIGNLFFAGPQHLRDAHGAQLDARDGDDARCWARRRARRRRWPLDTGPRRAACTSTISVSCKRR